ncbi:hypothetical protein DL770_010695 [Monosporascus sp. CRB-9-2]|nr:hypothetical protein DL770_010695 [Monosporascus sp. CRB-9-2]
MYQLGFWLGRLLSLYLPLPTDPPAPLDQGLSSPPGRHTLSYRPAHEKRGDSRNEKEEIGFGKIRPSSFWRSLLGVRKAVQWCSPGASADTFTSVLGLVGLLGTPSPVIQRVKVEDSFGEK